MLSAVAATSTGHTADVRPASWACATVCYRSTRRKPTRGKPGRGRRRHVEPHARGSSRSTPRRKASSEAQTADLVTESKPPTYALRRAGYECPIQPNPKVKENKKPQVKGLTWGSL
jgi:hypothetical protein